MTIDAAGDTTVPPLTPTEALHAAFHRFDQAGLRMPPIPRDLLDQFRIFSDWRFGTRDCDPSDRGALVEEAGQPGTQDYVAFGHVGRGVNNWWLCCRLVVGPVAAFVRHGFGGVYQDADAGASAAFRSFVKLEELIVLAEAAEARGAWPAGHRLLVVQDDQQGSGWQDRGAVASPWHATPDAWTPALVRATGAEH